jgi:four helix bundle protein
MQLEGASVFLFEKLTVYQRALTFAERVSNLTEGFPRGHWYLADQLNRASLSISLNIAEGNGRWTEADRRHFFAVARGSVHECIPLLEMCRRKKLVAEHDCEELRAEVETLAKMLAGLMRRRARPKGRRDAG